MPENSQLEPHPIFEAIYSGNLEEVKNIIEKDRLSLEQVDENQDTPIFAAIYSESSDNLDIVKNIDPEIRISNRIEKFASMGVVREM